MPTKDELAKLGLLTEEEGLAAFDCPLTLAPFTQPIIFSTGNSFSKEMAEKLVQGRKLKDPLTTLSLHPLNSLFLDPDCTPYGVLNTALENAIQEWKALPRGALLPTALKAFRCADTQRVMQEPVLCVDGKNREKEQALQKASVLCPIPNRALQNLIEEFYERVNAYENSLSSTTTVHKEQEYNGCTLFSLGAAYEILFTSKHASYVELSKAIAKQYERLVNVYLNMRKKNSTAGQGLTPEMALTVFKDFFTLGPSQKFITADNDDKIVKLIDIVLENRPDKKTYHSNNRATEEERLSFFTWNQDTLEALNEAWKRKQAPRNSTEAYAGPAEMPDIYTLERNDLIKAFCRDPGSALKITQHQQYAVSALEQRNLLEAAIKKMPEDSTILLLRAEGHTISVTKRGTYQKEISKFFVYNSSLSHGKLRVFPRVEALINHLTTQYSTGFTELTPLSIQAPALQRPPAVKVSKNVDLELAQFPGRAVSNAAYTIIQRLLNGNKEERKVAGEIEPLAQEIFSAPTEHLYENLFNILEDQGLCLEMKGLLLRPPLSSEVCFARSIRPLAQRQAILKREIDKLEKSKCTLFFNSIVHKDKCALKTRLDSFLRKYDEIIFTSRNVNKLSDSLRDLFQSPENAIFKKHSGIWGTFLNLLDWISQVVFGSKKFQTQTQSLFETLITEAKLELQLLELKLMGSDNRVS